MLPDEANAAHIWDMYEAGREALNFLHDVPLSAFMSDRQLRRAVERDLEILGEAARRVSLDFQVQHPEIPWRDVIGLRNILAHDYGNVLPERVWTVAQEELGDLLDALQKLMPSTEP